VTRLPESARFCLRVMLLPAGLALAAGCDAPKHNRAPLGSASAESCARWTLEVCKQTQEESEACSAVKTTSEILTPGVCAAALSDLDGLRKKLSERKQKCTELASKLCHDVGEKARACRMVRDQTHQFTPERCMAMLNAYAEVLTNLERQAAQRQLPAEKAALLTAGDPPAFGPAGAKLQLVEFVDFENRDCIRAASIVRELEAKYGDQLHFVLRQFPLPYNPHAQLAAEAALAAHAQGKFWELHDKLLANQKQLDRASLERYAKELQLDLTQFRAALEQKKYAAAVHADRALGEELSVVGMPTMFLNGERLLDAVDRQGIVDAIEERLSVGN
jgi:protein-disulfide isomerase